MKDFQDLILDGTKIGWHADRVKAWENGQRVAPVTIDMALTRAFYKVRWNAVEQNFRKLQYKVKEVNQRARDRQEVQGLQFEQLYTENTALQRQLKAMERTVQDLTTKAELWRRRCIVGTTK